MQLKLVNPKSLKYDPRGQAIWFSGGDQSVYITILENKITSFEIIIDRMILEGKLEGQIKFGLISAAKVQGTQRKGSRVVQYTAKIPSRLLAKSCEIIESLDPLEDKIKTALIQFLKHFLKSSISIPREQNPLIFDKNFETYDPNWRDYSGNIDHEIESVKHISKSQKNKVFLLAFVIFFIVIGGGLKFYFSNIGNLKTDFKKGIKTVSKSMKVGPRLKEFVSQDLLKKLEIIWKFNGISYLKTKNCDLFSNDLADSFTILNQKELHWNKVGQFCQTQKFNGSICQHFRESQGLNKANLPSDRPTEDYRGYWEYQDLKYIIRHLGTERFLSNDLIKKFYTNPYLGSFKKIAANKSIEEVKREATTLCLSFTEYQLYNLAKDQNKNRMYEIFNQISRLEKSESQSDFIAEHSGFCQEFIDYTYQKSKETLLKEIVKCTELKQVPEDIVRADICNGSYPLACNLLNK